MISQKQVNNNKIKNNKKKYKVIKNTDKMIILKEMNT